MIDLHTHSTASDGSMRPSELVAYAAKSGVKALALTDHDTLAGLDEAALAAREVGLRLIRGIEVDIEFKPGEFHLLGLFLDSPTDALRDALLEVARERGARNAAMIEKLRQEGIPIDVDDLERFAPGGQVGRLHLARLLVEKKTVKNVKQAFERYLAKGRPCYAPRAGIGLLDAIRHLKSSGALVVLAHPLSLFLSWGKLLPYLRELKGLGVDGIEAWHPIARPGACARLERFAREEGLLVTGGSDWHGHERGAIKLGHGPGGRKIDPGLLGELDTYRVTCAG